MHAFLHRLLVAPTLVSALVMAGPAAAGPFTSLVVFGDSLSDNGNNAAAGLYDPTQIITGNGYVPSSTYASGVYSNGPVWASDLAAMLGVPLAPSLLGGTDFAFGGATTGTPGPGPGGFPFSLLAQAGQYLTATGNHASSSALYVIAGGGNDVRAALAAVGSGADPLATIAATTSSFVANIGAIVDELQTAGAIHIVVWDAPNVGLAPAVVAGGGASALSILLADQVVSPEVVRARMARGVRGPSVLAVMGGGGRALSPEAITNACSRLYHLPLTSASGAGPS